MLKLNLPQEPYWLDLEDGVEVQVRPLTTAVMNMAHARAVRSIVDLKQQALNGEAGIPNVDDDETRQFVIEAVLAQVAKYSTHTDRKYLAESKIPFNPLYIQRVDHSTLFASSNQDL